MADSTRQLEFGLIRQTPLAPRFPTTRYQGSKRRLVEWIWDSVKQVSFDTALDVFGGTGAVAYRLKQAGKQVTYNDILAFNHAIGLALIENNDIRLDDGEVEQLLKRDGSAEYGQFIADTFEGIYFTPAENEWLDTIIQNINRQLDNSYKRAVALFALYQACMVKRPYNLFHRKNLYIREANVERSFGNKRTWDTPFEDHYIKFVTEANAAIFDNGRLNTSLNIDALSISPQYDLVYIDPPYVNRQGVSVNYHEFYHFLEGLTLNDRWESLIDFKSKHRRLMPQPSPWNDKDRIHEAFRDLFAHFADSILVVSYRSDGIPSREELVAMLRKHKRTVVQAALPQQYALSKNTSSRELLLIGI